MHIFFFDNGYFGQILEGFKSAGEEKWGNIQKYSRHHNGQFLGIQKLTGDASHSGR